MANWTETDLQDYYRRIRTPGESPAPRPDLNVEAKPKKHLEPKISVPRRGLMNGWEACYAEELEVQRRLGLIQWFGFESLRLRLANGCYYCPDFIIQPISGRIRAVEIKGHMRAAAMVRFKVAAE